MKRWRFGAAIDTHARHLFETLVSAVVSSVGTVGVFGVFGIVCFIAFFATPAIILAAIDTM